MNYRNATVDIVVGNLWSRVLEPAPVELLHRELNRGLGGAPGDDLRPEHLASLVFRPRSRRVLTGALPKVRRLLREHGYRYRLRDPRLPIRPRHRFRTGDPPLRDYQETVVRAALARGRGVVDVGTGGGKTRIAAEIIARLGLPALYLVTTRTLLRQVCEELAHLLNVDVGVVGAGAHRPAPVTVALVQSLLDAAVDLAPWREGTLIFDEGHHGCAPRFLDTVTRVDPRTAIFLSAVPFRTGRDQHVLDALTGGSLTGRAYAARYLIDHGYCVPVDVEAIPVAIDGDMTEKPFWQLYQAFIVENGRRNDLAAAAARDAIAAGRSTLVLVEHVRHGEILRERIGGEAAFAHGELTRAALDEITRRFADRRIPALVATSALFAEGVSIHGIECLVNAGALKSKVRVLQGVGRGMRLAPGKRSVRYVDFRDDDRLGVFRRHSRERLAVLREEGFHVPRLVEEEHTIRSEDPPEATWMHVPGTREFIRVAADGRVTARGRCLRRELVPDRFCGRCADRTLCQRGGRTTWQESAR